MMNEKVAYKYFADLHFVLLAIAILPSQSHACSIALEPRKPSILLSDLFSCPNPIKSSLSSASLTPGVSSAFLAKCSHTQRHSQFSKSRAQNHLIIIHGC